MKTLHQIFISLLFITSIFAINSLSAQNFYVSTTGLDTNPGTEALPWKTVAKAASVLTAGQTAFVRGGTYNERFTFTNSGTEGNYITVTAYPNDTSIIDGTGLGSVSLVSLGSKSYIKVSGLRVQNGYIGIFCGGTNSIIENNYVYNFTNPGISLSAASNCIVRNNIVEKAVSSSWGECLTLSQCEYIDVCNNEIKNGTKNTAGGEGIDVKGSKHIRVYGNVIHDLPAKLGIYIDAYDGLDYDIQIFNNKIYNCTNGIVIGSELANDVEKIWAYNNVIYNMTTGEGIKVVDYIQRNYRAKNIIIENNTMTACKGTSIDAPNGS
ncbi:MAG: right-handed parallel beta-helix repeat-containing protein, partial [Paludibacter sp.]